ncbi:MAG: hypothetical protein AAB723_03430 [Patescibacteria group bacterium]
MPQNEKEKAPPPPFDDSIKESIKGPEHTSSIEGALEIIEKGIDDIAKMLQSGTNDYNEKFVEKEVGALIAHMACLLKSARALEEKIKTKNL